MLIFESLKSRIFKLFNKIEIQPFKTTKNKFGLKMVKNMSSDHFHQTWNHQWILPKLWLTMLSHKKGIC